jgi:Ca2+-binding EF-hand superfamily protein
MSKTNQ